MSVALHAPPVDAMGFPLRAPHPDLLALCYELQGRAALPLNVRALQRVAAVWRGPGTWEERMIATMRAAQAEGPSVWEDICTAAVRQDEYEEALAKLYFADLRKGIENAPSELTRRMRKKHLAAEFRAFITRHVPDSDD